MGVIVNFNFELFSSSAISIAIRMLFRTWKTLLYQHYAIWWWIYLTEHDDNEVKSQDR